MDENYIKIKIKRRCKKGQDSTPSPTLSWPYNEPHELGLLPKPSKSRWVLGHWAIVAWAFGFLQCIVAPSSSIPPRPVHRGVGCGCASSFLKTKSKCPIYLLIFFQKLNVWNHLKSRIGFKLTYPSLPNVTRTYIYTHNTHVLIHHI
jgi:hypothetical protein